MKIDSTKLTTRAEQKELRRWEILGAALDLFIRSGYAATKIQDIADKVGMSVGLLFHYFPSKEALYIELIKLGIYTPIEMLQGFADAEPLEYFSRAAEKTLEFASSSTFTAKMFVLMSNISDREGIPAKAKEIMASADFYRGMEERIVKGQANGTIREGHPKALYTAFWAAIQGSVKMHAINAEIPLPQAEWFVDMVKGKKS